MLIVVPHSYGGGGAVDVHYFVWKYLKPCRNFKSTHSFLLGLDQALTWSNKLIAPVSNGQSAVTAVSSVGAVHLVLTPSTLRDQVAGQVMLEVWPVRH